MAATERIAELEEELKTTKYNKATSKAVGLLKAKIARLKREEEVAAKKSGGGGLSYAVRKSGDATALLVGFPSVGKSTLLNRLTNADSRVAAYEFTTLDVIPGMLEYKGAKIQLLDVPGIVLGAATGKGRGREVLSVVRNADLVIILVDARKPEQVLRIREELYNANLRLDQHPPDISIKRKVMGGLHITSAFKLTHLDEDFVKQVLAEYSIHNADVVIRDDVTVDQLIDAVVGNRKYVPSLVVLNKSDLLSIEELWDANHKVGKCLILSAEKDGDLTEIKDSIFTTLKFTRVFMKRIGEEPDMKDPLIITGIPTIRAVCLGIHKDFLENFNYAKVWGTGAKFDGQTVGLDHIVHDSDVVEIHNKR